MRIALVDFLAVLCMHDSALLHTQQKIARRCTQVLFLLPLLPCAVWLLLQRLLTADTCILAETGERGCKASSNIAPASHGHNFGRMIGAPVAGHLTLQGTYCIKYHKKSP
jgi:hypothetical protein